MHDILIPLILNTSSKFQTVNNTVPGQLPAASTTRVRQRQPVSRVSGECMNHTLPLPNYFEIEQETGNKNTSIVCSLAEAADGRLGVPEGFQTVHHNDDDDDDDDGGVTENLAHSRVLVITCRQTQGTMMIVEIHVLQIDGDQEVMKARRKKKLSFPIHTHSRLMVIKIRLSSKKRCQYLHQETIMHKQSCKLTSRLGSRRSSQTAVANARIDLVSNCSFVLVLSPNLQRRSSTKEPVMQFFFNHLFCINPTYNTAQLNDP